MPGIGLGMTARRGASPALLASLPSLDLDFLKGAYQMSLIGKAFSEIFTFTRASGGGRINASGVYEWVAANQSRIDHSPVNLASGLISQTITLNKDRAYAVTIVGGGTVQIAGAGVDLSKMGASSGYIVTPAGSGTIDVVFTVGGVVTAVHVREALGILIEEQRTNLLTFSDDFSASGWVSGASGLAAFGSGSVANAVISPDGSTSADKICVTATNTVHRFSRGTSVVSGGVYTASVFAKRAEMRYLGMKSGVVGAAQPVFDLQTGLVVEGVGKIEPYGNGWFRCSHTFTMDSAMHIAYWTLLNSSSFGAESFAGTANEGLYLWGAQLEAGSFATSYITTSGSQVTRAADKQNAPTGQWLKALQGTLYVEYSDDCANSSTLVQLSSGDGGSAVWIVRGTSGVNCMVNNGGMYRSAPANGLARSIHKAAVTWDASGNFMSCCDGQSVASNTQPNGAPTVTGGLRIGCDNLVAAWANGHIRAAKYLPATRTAAQLQALTA